MAATFLRFDGVTLGYDAGTPILEDVSLELPEASWTGVVGENGSGKTTLLRALVGQLEPLSGRVLRSPGLELVWCPQSTSELTDEIALFAEDWRKEALRLRQALALDEGSLQRFSTLSPGERRRWQVGAALSKEPDVLVLDEPTNHLDAESRTLLAQRLAQFRGRGVLVSHDQRLLARLVARVLWLEGGRARLYPGNFTQAHLLEREARRALEESARDARREEARLARVLADERRRHAAAERERSTKHRMRNPATTTHAASTRSTAQTPQAHAFRATCRRRERATKPRAKRARPSPSAKNAAAAWCSPAGRALRRRGSSTWCRSAWAWATARSFVTSA